MIKNLESVHIQSLKHALSNAYGDEKYHNSCKKLGIIDDPGNIWRAAVALVLIEKGLFIIKRSTQVRTHKGQLAFPGGHREPGEDDPVVTALREFNEETLHPENILDLVGILPATFAGPDFAIIPVVFECQLKLSEFKKPLKPHEEWDEALHTPISSLLPLDSWQHGQRWGVKSHNSILFKTLARGDYDWLVGHDKQSPLLWGATARMVWNLLNLLNE